MICHAKKAVKSTKKRKVKPENLHTFVRKHSFWDRTAIPRDTASHDNVS